MRLGLGSFPREVSIAAKHQSRLPGENLRRKPDWGQAHRWFGFRVLTTDVHPVCDGVEFSSWKWMTADELVDGVVEFRRRSYDEVLRGR